MKDIYDAGGTVKDIYDASGAVKDISNGQTSSAAHE